MKTAVIIPAYNEGERIQKVLKKVINYSDKIIVVDDGSIDDTYNKSSKIAENIVILRHDLNLGKGAALKTGCEAAIKFGADIIICMDADEQHNAEDIPKFINKIQAGNDIVFGSRIIGKSMPFTRFIGNKFLSTVICKLYKILIHDTQSGFRAFTADTYQKIKWGSADYAVETEMIIKTAENKLKFEEITIDTVYHDNYKGVTPINGLQIFFRILKWKFL